MKKIIQTLPKIIFDKNYSNELFLFYNYACFISILDIDNNEKKYDETIDNFLQVKMWDIEYDIFEENKLQYQKPNDEELIKIVEFINRHKDKSVFIIHCSAGISRSGAVARFIHDKFYDDVNIHRFNNDNKHIQPNLYILKRLKELDSI